MINNEAQFSLHRFHHIKNDRAHTITVKYREKPVHKTSLVKVWKFPAIGKTLFVDRTTVLFQENTGHVRHDRISIDTGSQVLIGCRFPGDLKMLRKK